jgi:hypothetical protein
VAKAGGDVMDIASIIYIRAATASFMSIITGTGNFESKVKSQNQKVLGCDI